MTESLRDRVETALVEHIDSSMNYSMHRSSAEAVAKDVTAVVFETMGEARPCVTCGKGIGPAKVAKGYVQCYDCRSRKR